MKRFASALVVEAAPENSYRGLVDRRGGIDSPTISTAAASASAAKVRSLEMIGFRASRMKKAKRIEAGKRHAPPRSWSQQLRAAPVPLVVCGLAFLIYSRSLLCGFVRDDTAQILHNRQVQSWAYLPELLGSHLWSQVPRHDVNILFYRPIFSLWMLLVHTFGGLAPWFWHLSSMLLHVAATYLVFRFCQLLTKSDMGAAGAAAIFAVHPIHVEAVTWVSASCEMLFAIFALAALLALLDHNKNGNPRVWVSAMCFGAGLFAKETGIAMLAILVVFAWAQLKGLGGGTRFWKATHLYCLVTGIYLLIRWAVMHRVVTETREHSWAEVIFSSPSILLFYLRKLFLPWKLSGCYTNPLMASATSEFWLQLTAVLLGLAVVGWFGLRRSPLLGLAAALIVIPVLPALTVVRIYRQGDMTHDRYLYVPSIGLALLVALLVRYISSLEKPARFAGITAVIVVLMAFSAETIAQQRYYQDDAAFYSRVIEITPSDGFARGMLGNVYLNENRIDLALEEFQKANQIAPDDPKVTLILARGLFVAGRKQEAENVLKGLLDTRELDSRRRNLTLVALANVEISLGNLDNAQQLLQQVEQSDDRVPELHWAYGVLYQKRGILPLALAEFEKEFEITGDELAQQRSAAVARMIYLKSARNSSMGDSRR